MGFSRQEYWSGLPFPLSRDFPNPGIQPIAPVTCPALAGGSLPLSHLGSAITSWQIDGETMETVTDFISWAPESLQMVPAAMKLKDACSLEEKL